jgi:3-oxoacyl-[acyl-carrier protein] reductase
MNKDGFPYLNWFKMNKNALITGGTRGIGLGIARSLASEGYQLAVNGIRNETEVIPVIKNLESYGVKVLYCRGDISNRNDRLTMVEMIRKNFNRLNLLVNNAGMAPRERKDILEATEDSFEEIIRNNLQGPYFLTQEIANWMIREMVNHPDYKPRIINISSVSSSLASVNRGDYCISKAGISMMTQLYAVRLSQYGIPVYEIRPGIVDTDMTKGVKEKYDSMLQKGLCLQPVWGQPADVGRAAAMLARGDLSYSTGQVIMVDGGMTIGRF